jgi:L-threonylcarbamoyladenylate synthase
MTDSGPAPILPASDPANILAVAARIREGGVVAVPTDTVYGLAASIFKPEAIARIFAVKRRAPDTAVPVLIATAADLPLLVEHVPRPAWTLINRFWPGPLTLVLPARDTVPAAVTRGRETVAVRVPAGRSVLLLLETLGEPIIGTSANRHREPPATTAAAVAAELGTHIDAILADDRAVVTGSASTVAEVSESAIQLHREGVVSIEAIRQAMGPRFPVRR